MILKIKRFTENAVMPTKAHSWDAGFDLTATTKEWDSVNSVLVFGTGIGVEIPKGYVGLLVPRSSVYKTGLSLANCCGIVDAGYQGELRFMFYPGDRPKHNYEVGHRIGQLVLVPIPEFTLEEVNNFETTTERGTKGYGSSGA